MNSAIEPTTAAFANPLKRYVAATRPAFLSVTLVGALLGLASAAHAGLAIDTSAAMVTVLFALLAHAGANVLNDYFDARNGSDAANTERVYPFTGGSRFIQNGVLSAAATARFGALLLGTVVPAGLWLTMHSAPGLLWIGLAGLLTGWAYSAPPLQLASRGLGEVAITAAWLLIVVGSDYVQRRAFAPAPVAAGSGYALLVASVLYINQFPDVRADAQAGKRTLVVRLGVMRARWGYALLVALCVLAVVAGVVNGHLSPAALLSLLPLAASAGAFRLLWVDAATPARLAPALKLTILAALAHGLMMGAALLYG